MTEISQILSNQDIWIMSENVSLEQCHFNYEEIFQNPKVSQQQIISSRNYCSTIQYQSSSQKMFIFSSTTRLKHAITSFSILVATQNWKLILKWKCTSKLTSSSTLLFPLFTILFNNIGAVVNLQSFCIRGFNHPDVIPFRS